MKRSTIEIFTGPLSFPEPVPKWASYGGERVTKYRRKLTESTNSHLRYASFDLLLGLAILSGTFAFIAGKESAGIKPLLFEVATVPPLALSFYHIVGTTLGNLRLSQLDRIQKRKR